MKSLAVIATNTLGMGARPGEIRDCRSDPKGWVKSQVSNPAPLISDLSNAASSEDLVKSMSKNKTALARKLRANNGRKNFNDRQKSLKTIAGVFEHELAMRHQQAVRSTTSFVERWTWFWSDHFTVSARDKNLKSITGAFEREVVRPNVFGTFYDMLLASSLHPAMLYYLDNVRSVGPNSTAGRKSDAKHNENLGREILELHTLGVDGGYSLEDITALSHGLTGWTRASQVQGGFSKFIAKWHEKGTIRMLGNSYRNEGPERIKLMLADLTRHPSTARFIAEKLAAHFLPSRPQTAIDKLAENFLETGGDLKALAFCLIDLDEVWSDSGWIVKRPDEFVVSVGRALPEWEYDYNPKIHTLLGQPVLQSPGPDGWEQTGDNWINAESIMIRLGWLRRSLKNLPRNLSSDDLVDQILGGYLTRQTDRVISKSSSSGERLTLLFMSPEFLRR